MLWPKCAKTGKLIEREHFFSGNIQVTSWKKFSMSLLKMTFWNVHFRNDHGQDDPNMHWNNEEKFFQNTQNFTQFTLNVSLKLKIVLQTTSITVETRANQITFGMLGMIHFL